MTEQNEPTIEQLKAQLSEMEQKWWAEYKRRVKQDKMLEACLEVIKHLQNRA